MESTNCHHAQAIPNSSLCNLRHISELLKYRCCQTKSGLSTDKWPGRQLDHCLTQLCPSLLTANQLTHPKSEDHLQVSYAKKQYIPTPPKFLEIHQELITDIRHTQWELSMISGMSFSIDREVRTRTSLPVLS